MSSRTDLHNELVRLFESNNVYYQPPENLKMNYPAIVYYKGDIDKQSADNIGFILTDSYTVTVISPLPDNPVIKKILSEIPMSSYDRSYISDKLNHDVLTIYY